MLFALKAWIAAQAIIASGGLVAGVVIFCRAKGTWRERYRNNFGGGA